MNVLWEFWPKEKGGTQDDPISGKQYVHNLQEALALTETLKNKYGKNLIFVDLTMRIVG